MKTYFFSNKVTVDNEATLKLFLLSENRFVGNIIQKESFRKFKDKHIEEF